MNTPSQVMRARIHLLHELKAGRWRPGAAISVKDTAKALKLSPTPVREALAMLTGEGAVAPAGDRNGFVVPRLGLRGYIEITELVRLLLDGVLAIRGLPRPSEGDTTLCASIQDPLAATEATIGWIADGGGNGTMAFAIKRAGTVLAAYRRAEAMVIPDWHDQLLSLRSEVANGRGRQAIAAYHGTRVDLAARLVDAAEHPRGPARYIPDIVGIG